MAITTLFNLSCLEMPTNTSPRSHLPQLSCLCCNRSAAISPIFWKGIIIWSKPLWPAHRGRFWGQSRPCWTTFLTMCKVETWAPTKCQSSSPLRSSRIMYKAIFNTPKKLSKKSSNKLFLPSSRNRKSSGKPSMMWRVLFWGMKKLRIKDISRLSVKFSKSLLSDFYICFWNNQI